MTGHPLSSAHCPVCGNGLEGKLTSCPRCETPHHEECYKYNDGCAIYACSPRSLSVVPKDVHPHLRYGLEQYFNISTRILGTGIPLAVAGEIWASSLRAPDLVSYLASVFFTAAALYAPKVWRMLLTDPVIDGIPLLKVEDQGILEERLDE